jgi:RING finger/CHY zinc finger protein 1
VKGENEFVHCDTCRTCVSASNHKCKEEQFHTDCPICMENMFYSTKPSNAIPCGHTMHVHCMHECFQRNQTSCPLCRKTMLSSETWSKYNELMDEFIHRFPIQEALTFRILCNDCGFNGDAHYHPHGMKCGGCGGYNTSRN